jgi:cytochrome P450
MDFVKKRGRHYELFDEWHRQYGDIVKVPINGKNEFFLFNPDDIATAFRMESKFPQRTNVEPWALYRKLRNLPVGITMEDGPAWKRVRDSIAKLLQPETVATYVHRMSQVAGDYAELVGLEAGKDGQHMLRDLRQITSRFTTEAIAAVLLGTRLELLRADKPVSGASRRLIDSMYEMFATSEALVFGPPTWRFWETKVLKRHYQAWDTVFEASQTILADKSMKHMDDNVNDFLNHVRSFEGKLSPLEVTTMSVELLAAGVDTTANSFLIVLFNVAGNKDVQRKARQEIQRVLGERQHFGNEDLKQLKYIKAIVEEALRVYPVIPNMNRVVREAVEIGGYHFPKGTSLNLGVWTPGRSEKNFKNALTFNPDRYSEEKGHPFASAVFGAGARMCPGKRLAHMEMEVALIQLLRRFEIEGPPSFPPILARLLNTPDFESGHQYLSFKPLEQQSKTL